MAGKYRPIGVAEKRAMLEAVGEEWPIGSDGLPKVWSSKSTRPTGGGWRLCSSSRSGRRSYEQSEKAIATKSIYYQSERGRFLARSQLRRQRRREMSLCLMCGNRLDCESNVRCWSCLDKDKERHAFAY